MQELIGIASYQGIRQKKGIRLTERLLFGSIAENEQTFSLHSVELQPQTEVYGSALAQENVNNENLAPVFWRYQRSADSGSVYVADQNLMGSTMGYSVISFLFADLYQAYLYPIVNAYCFIVSGMPYAEDFMSAFLQAEYERSSLGVQNDVFLPQFRRCEQQYGVKTTWYSKDKEKVKSTSSTLLQYYLNQIRQNEDEIGLLSADGQKRSVSHPFENQLMQWSPEFSWMQEEEIGIPYRSLGHEKYRNILFQDMGMIKGMGFHSVFVDAEPFYQEYIHEDWIDFCRNLEVVLGVEKQEVPWLDRVTVGEAIYRIQAFSVMEPEILYSDAGIDVTIGNFAEKAYFYLITPNKIESAENAKITKLGDGFYMIEANQDHIRISYQE